MKAQTGDCIRVIQYVGVFVIIPVAKCSERRVSGLVQISGGGLW